MASFENLSMNSKSFESLQSFDTEVPGWLNTFRQPAREAFLNSGWPSKKHEDWRYTSLRSLEKHDFNWSHTKGLIHKSVMETYFRTGEWPVVFVDGVYDSTQTFSRDLPEGLTIVSLKKAWHEHEVELKNFLDRRKSKESHAFTLLNEAFLLNGAFIKVAPNTVLENPIHILFINTNKPKPFSLFPRVMMDLGPLSQATLITSFEHQGHGTYLHDGAIDVHIQSGAELRHFTMQNASHNAYHYERTQIDLAKDARYRAFNFSIGGKLGRQELHINLNGEGAAAKADGVYLVSGDRQIDNYSNIEHHVAHCESSQFYKGILNEEGRGVFSGKVFVHKHAQKTNAFQMNKNLLLSEGAEVNTKPQLLIDADDVKCSHGATIGRLKEDELFYLESRGIDRTYARSMLSRAFATELILDVDHEPFQDRAMKLLKEWVEA